MINMLVKDIMSGEVCTAGINITVKEAARMMVEAGSKHLIIVDGNRLAGIVTEWDFVTNVVSRGKDPAKMKVGEIMTKNVIVGTPDMDITEAAEAMVKNKIKKLPIVSGNMLVGMVTAMDLIAAEPKMIEQIGNLVMLAKKGKPMAG